MKMSQRVSTSETNLIDPRSLVQWELWRRWNWTTQWKSRLWCSCIICSRCKVDLEHSFSIQVWCQLLPLRAKAAWKSNSWTYYRSSYKVTVVAIKSNQMHFIYIAQIHNHITSMGMEKKKKKKTFHRGKKKDDGRNLRKSHRGIEVVAVVAVREVPRQLLK